MNQMDAIISPQIPPTEGGGVKKDAPPPQSQPENGEEQKTQIVSCKSDLQQPSIDTKKEVTSTEMTSIVNGDIQSVETEDQFYDCLTESGENTLPEIPSNNESLSLSSVKEKPTSLSSKATEASTEQVSENFTAKPASTDDTAFGLPASSDVKNTALSNSANKKTANEKTPEKPTAIEKTTSPQASSIEETSTLPASTNEKTTPLPETTTEIISATPQDSNDEKTTSPLDSTNEMTTPPPVSTNEKNTTPSESANKRTTTEKTTLPPASPSVITTHEKPTNIEMNTTPRASTNETTSTLPASTKEKTTLPASTTETIPVSLGSNDDNNKPPPASTNEKTTTPQASNNETTSTSPASTKGKTTKGKERKGRDMRPTLPASTPETISASLGSRDDSNKPPPASTDEETTSPLDSTNEKTTTLQASNNETTSTLPASTKGKERKGRDLRPALPASTTETISASLGSRDDKNKTPPASTDDETTSPLDSTNEKTTTLPASTTETISASLGPRDDQNKSPPTSTNEKNTTPPESANTRTAIERTTTPLASTNETTPILPASTKEKTTPLPASTTETVSASLGSRDDKNKPPPASTNEVICSLPVSTNAKTTPPSDSADKKTTEQKDAYLLASTDENIAHSPASTNETISALLGPASEKTTPSTASANEKAMPLPALTIETTSTESNSTSLGSGDDKTTPPSVVTNKIPPASTDEKTTSSLDSASRKTKNEVIIPPPAPNNEKTNETTTTPSASTKEKTTPAKSPAKENAAPPLSSTSPLVSNDITSKNERTTPLPVPSSIPITSSNGESITPLSSSKEKTLSPQDYESGKTTSSPEPINKKPLVSEVSAKAKIAASKSTDPSTRKKEFILKPLNLPQIPIAPGSSFQSRDSPSSWLDVDHQRPKKKKLLIPEPNLSSSVSETNLLNVSGEFDPDDFITNVKRLAMPFNLPQRKHNKHRLQAPPFAMPAIKEDRFEKPFDPEEFQYGLRRRREFIFDLAPNAISKSQDTEVKEVDIKPKRESILTRSLIFQRARKESEKEEKEEGSDENTTEPPKAKSRLERCSIVSMLRSPSKGRRMEFLSPTESPSDGPLSPSDGSGSTAPALSQLAPTTKPPKLISVEETLAKNDSHSAQSGSQVILKPSRDIGPAMTPDLKTTSKDTTIAMFTDTNTPFLPSGTQTSSQVVPKPTKDDEPTQAPDLKATSADPSVTLLTDTNTSSPSSGSQVVLKPIKDDGPPMTPDLKATSMDTTVTLLTDTNAPSPPNGSRTSSKVVPKPTKDDRLSQAPDLKATSADPPVTVLTDTNAPPPASSGSQNVLKPIETGTTDLKANSRDPTVTLLTDTNTPSPANGSQTFQVVLKDDGPTLTPVLKTTSLDPPVTMLTDSAPPPPSSGSQNVVKPIKDDGPAITPDPKTNSRDPTVTMFTDTKPPPLLNDTQTDSGVVLQPDGPTLKPTTVDPVVTKITDANAPPSLPSFDGIKLPSFLEKFLPKEPENTQLPKKIDPLVARESASVPGLVDLNKAVDAAAGKIPEVTIPPAPVVPAAQIPQAKPQRELPNIPAARGIHRRPAKIVIFEHPQFSGQSFEFYRDQPDATHMQLSSVVSIKVVRGCWILYEKPGFQGRCIALEEERVTDLPNEWAEEGEETSAPVVIGSVRLAVRDYTPPRIELFTEPTGMGRSFEYVDDTEEVGSYSRPQNTGSIKVHSGLWLVYSDPGFQGLLAVLEAGEYPFPQDWGFPVPMVGSLRPLRMGAMKVENPNAVKAVLYEKAGLQGRCVEVQGDVFSFTTTETDPSDSDNHGLNCVESLKILGGLWVGYDREGFDGQQFVLEEGEYLDWTDWGGTGEKLLSLRPVFMDFSSPHMKMFSEPDFSERGASIDLVEPLYNVADTRYGLHTRSIEVLAGVWVAFEGAGFSGQQYVLEKGLYGSPEDWGASHSRICSAVPVVLENLENSCHFQIELFSESGFGGTSVLVQDALPTMPSGFSVRSCRVHAGSWLAFSGECFSAHQCVLEEGFYSDLRTMGFTQPDVSVLSLQPTGFELSVPSVVLFERSGLRGRRTVLTTSSVNLQMTHSCSRVSSVLVLGGMWVLYEDHNFRGSQFLLKPGAIPDWPKLSSWLRIGSLRPLMQKQVHFRLRNNEAGLLMSVAGSLEDIKLMRIQVSEETGGAEQIWTYQDGLLQCKCLLDVCVDVSSGVLMSGSRAVLSAEPGKPQQLWNITTDGIIRSNAKPDLVLEVKGGQQFDKHQIIVNEFHPDKLNQRWSLEIL
ncbi:beta/gamma crystallin domain-containing protein 1 isoform X4 [Labeo rohita]|uniref:beta/gamma crystallin domain-containing protein 1 isoform X4 n=1 Tax=Labeo rohita TaxID=84645 RepID=UPI0021E248A2|nr:beta/gamma crystallin domain-containing protein 1 isoform X4 [Labeo rohita]